MSWWRNYFWIILAVAIVVISSVLGLILYCVCRWQLRQGKKWEIAKSLKQNQREEEKMYENVLHQSPGPLPPLPPRGSFSQEYSSSQETPSQLPATYSSVNKDTKKTIPLSGYAEPDNDYDDVDIPESTGNHKPKTAISSFWHDKEGSHNLF